LQGPGKANNIPSPPFVVSDVMNAITFTSEKMGVHVQVAAETCWLTVSDVTITFCKSEIFSPEFIEQGDFSMNPRSPVVWTALVNPS
jgi:hypothetical protein